MTEEPFRTIIEPFRIHSVEPMRLTTGAERAAALAAAGYNLFELRAADVLIDLLTDSGTGAMSAEQWAGIQRGNEAYAGASSFYRFRDAVTDLFPFRHVLPAHQGRAAEKILFTVTGGPGQIVPNNTHFDTTRANIEFTGAQAVDLPIPEGLRPSVRHPFKGNMDTVALEKLLSEQAGAVPLVMLTITNNSGGGQPVSLANIRAVREVCDRFGKPLFLDACRFAENAWFIKSREEGYAAVPVAAIVREIAALADGMTMSAKKDPLANIGGWLALNDDRLAEQCRNLEILTEGFPTYGGLAGRDLEAIAQGLSECVDEDYLQYRVRSVAYLGEALEAAGIPVVVPFGGHAVFIDARAMLPHIDPLHYPGQALACALYTEGGVRSCEIGTVMFGLHPDGTETPAPLDLVRLAIPRRTYTQSHIDYVIEVAARVARRGAQLTGMRIVSQPRQLRHFTAQFAPRLTRRPRPCRRPDRRGPRASRFPEKALVPAGPALPAHRPGMISTGAGIRRRPAIRLAISLCLNGRSNGGPDAHRIGTSRPVADYRRCCRRSAWLLQREHRQLHQGQHDRRDDRRRPPQLRRRKPENHLHRAPAEQIAGVR
jgi:tryptophanase